MDYPDEKKYTKEEWKEPEHPIFNRTGAILLLFILLMFVLFLWERERYNCLTPEQRNYEDFKATQQP